MKTNAARLLDRLGVRYELREYEVDPEAFDAETVAAKISLPAEQVSVHADDRHGSLYNDWRPDHDAFGHTDSMPPLLLEH